MMNGIGISAKNATLVVSVKNTAPTSTVPVTT